MMTAAMKLKEYYQNNREKILVKRKKHYQDNREYTISRQKEYYQNNIEKIRKRSKIYAIKYRENNREILLYLYRSSSFFHFLYPLIHEGKLYLDVGIFLYPIPVCLFPYSFCQDQTLILLDQ